MSEPRTVAQLFEPEPRTWGLRGDPYLWRQMRERFASTPWPAGVEELERQIGEAFAALTGRPLATPEHFFVEAFAHGGMSSGLVDPSFWREQALPLLRARYAGA